jgi:transglutaminase-like putative cysteine protease
LQSNDPLIVTVDTNGIITGKGAGTALVTGSVDGISASCTVIIHDLGRSIATGIYLSNLTYAQNHTEVKPEHLQLKLPNDDINRLTSLAKDITKGASTDYAKAKAIAKWVAANIYYDYEYSGGIPTAVGVLESKKSVCSGYAILTETLLRCIGIPARRIADAATHVDWDEADLASWRLGKPTNVGPHEWNEACVDGRWVIKTSM